MGAVDFELMSLDELWSLHESLAEMLAKRLTSEKAALETRLKKLNQTEGAPKTERSAAARRPYPVVIPKYRNPNDPSETWSGRGKQPRWLVADRCGARPPLNVAGVFTRKLTSNLV
jgi:DNA-binding protein H-NS